MVWLAQRGAGDVLTRAKTVTEWNALYARVLQRAVDDEDEATLYFNGGASAASTGSSSAATTADPAIKDKEEKMKRVVRDVVDRSQRAYGHLYSSIPEALQRQVRHLPTGFAFGLWSWIKEKF